MKLALLLIALTSLPACGIFNVQGPGGGHSATTHSSSMSDARARKRQRMARQNAADRERLSRAREARNRRINARKKVERAERDVRLKRRELVAAISKDMKRFRVTLKGGAPLLPGEVAIVATRIARLRSMDAKHAGTYSRELFAMRLDSARNGDASGKGFADLVGGKLVKHEAVAWKQSPSNAMAFAMRKGRCYLGILHHPTTRTPLSNYTVDRLEMVAKKPSGHVPFTLYGSDFYIMRGTCAHRNTKAAWSYRTNNQDQRRRSWSMTIVSFERAAIPKWVRNRYAYRAPAACDVSSFTNMWRYPLAGLTGFIANQPVAYTDQGFMAITGQRISGEFAFEPSGPVRVGPPAVPPSLCRVMTADKLSRRAFKCMARASGRYRSALNSAGGAYDRATTRKGRRAAGNRYDDIEARSLEAQARCQPLMDKLKEWVAREKTTFARNWTRAYKPQPEVSQAVPF